MLNGKYNKIEGIMLELQKLSDMLFVGPFTTTIRNSEFLRLQLFLDSSILSPMAIKWGNNSDSPIVLNQCILFYILMYDMYKRTDDPQIPI